MNASKGNFLAVVGVLVMAGVLFFTGRSVTESINAPGCTAEVMSSASLDTKESVVVPAGQMALGTKIPRSFELNGPLCIALNAPKYFDERAMSSRAAEAASPAESKAKKSAVSDAVTAAEQPLEKIQKQDDAKRGNKEHFFDGKSIKLFIDGVDTRIVIPIGPNAKSADASDWLWLNWPIRPGEDQQAKTNWKKILGGANLLTGQRSVSIGVGNDTDTAPRIVTSDANKATLLVFHPNLVLGGIIGLLLIAAGLIVGNKNSGMLRDGSGSVRQAAQGQVEKEYLTTFSLSKVVLGVWLILTIGCFILLWVVTGNSDGIVTSEVLTLLGIQGSSGVASALMDDKEEAQPSTGNFLTDILFDGKSVTLYRIQMLAWTLILVAIFLWSVVSQLAFPQFDDDLLILAGIANGYYLGFKWPQEQKNTKVNPSPTHP